MQLAVAPIIFSLTIKMKGLKRTDGQRVTLRHIAEATGYTVATVSMALRNQPKINVATRRKIQRAARRLGYVPDPGITELMYRLRTVADPAKQAKLALATMFSKSERRSNPHLSVYHRSLLAAAAEYGYGIEEFCIPEFSTYPGRLERILHARGIRGVILSGLHQVKHAVDLDIRNFSVATTGYSRKISIHRACQNQYADTMTLLNQLRARGYRRPGMILSEDSDRRVNQHYTAAFRVHLAELEPHDRIEPCRLTVVTREALLEWLDATRPDVVVFHTPPPEVLQEWIHDSGRSVPGDIALASLDLPHAKLPFCGMIQNLAQTARATVDLVINQMHRDQRGLQDSPKTVLLEGTFHEGTTAPVRAMPPS
jgi:LacI family transcriptional regulator